ncbi:MAG TPA: hypothetical protein VN765_09695, partial [Candidatus Acidoferrum sp.]|nr:hypothetical protein [Candidatus Acidoferrum sp.]
KKITVKPNISKARFLRLPAFHLQVDGAEGTGRVGQQENENGLRAVKGNQTSAGPSAQAAVGVQKMASFCQWEGSRLGRLCVI